MSVRFSAAATLCVAALIPVSAGAADGDDLQSIRQQIDQLKAAYEGRIQALEARLQELQQRLAANPSGGAAADGRPALAQAAPAQAPAPPAPAMAPAGGGAQGSASAFNPAISLILNGTYANLSRDPANYRLQGFVPSGG
ncbi:MAG TPA: hypothetical protein VF308_14810, partial [Caldimonas sp.]